MKQLEVTIMGQSYILGCADGGETALLEAVESVDREMCAIRDAGKVKARERIAVLAALNIAFELAERSRQAAAQPVSSPSGEETASDLRVQGLIRRLDELLLGTAR